MTEDTQKNEIYSYRNYRKEYFYLDSLYFKHSSVVFVSKIYYFATAPQLLYIFFNI